MQEEKNMNSLGKTLFRYSDYTPIPLIIILLFVAKPGVFTATLGTLIVMLGELIRIYSVAFIGTISRTRSGSLGDTLITGGPFKFVRNPLYCGNFFIVAGLAVFSGSVGFTILTIALFYFQYHFIIQYEEKILEDKFQDEYRKYKQEVPAWIPDKIPGLDDIEWSDSYSKALKSEKRTLTAIAAMLALLILCS